MMVRCDYCMKNPFHTDKKCCFNCAMVSADCEVWHNCGEDCPGWKSKVMTNGDKIRAMDDETLATQLVQVFKEGILALVDMEVPDALLAEAWEMFYEKLKQPAEGSE